MGRGGNLPGQNRIASQISPKFNKFPNNVVPVSYFRIPTPTYEVNKIDKNSKN